MTRLLPMTNLFNDSKPKLWYRSWVLSSHSLEIKVVVGIEGLRSNFKIDLDQHLKYMKERCNTENMLHNLD